MKVPVPSFLRISRSAEPPKRREASGIFSPRHEKKRNDSMAGKVRSRQDDLQLQEELARVFRHFDADGDGKISVAELVHVLRSFGEEEISEKGVGEVMKEVDSDGDGCIDLHDFIRLNSGKAAGGGGEGGGGGGGGGEEEEEEVLMAAFRMFEMEKGECITPRGLQRMMVRLGESVSVEECRAMIRHADLDGDGVVSFHEFKHMMMANATTA